MELKIYKCKHCGKEFINRYLLTGHSTYCKLNPNYEHNRELINKLHEQIKKPGYIRKIDKRIDCNCQYCNKLYFSLNSLRLHEIRCKLNPERIIVVSNFIKYNNDPNKIVWNKGLTELTSESVKKAAETLRMRYKNNEIIPTLLGHHKTEEEKLHIRLGTLRYLETCNAGFFAKYNKNSIKYIDNLNKEKGWHLLHAENGGEYKCIGYFLDGYDKDLNIVFEYDEPRHYKDIYNNILIDKDILRQTNIINELHCEFWRYNEKIDKLYRVN